jgi:hypothetical protein
VDGGRPRLELCGSTAGRRGGAVAEEVRRLGLEESGGPRKSTTDELQLLKLIYIIQCLQVFIIISQYLRLLKNSNSG